MDGAYFCCCQLGIIFVNKYDLLLEWGWTQLNDNSIFTFMIAKKPSTR